MDQVAEIRDKLDIVSLISESVALKRAGRNFSGLCPFHNEKSPSFMVSPERQIWHCFGCFPPGQKVKTPFGYHAIEEIDENHWVVSGKGNIRKVIAKMEHQYKGDLITVKLRKLKGEVQLTSDHTVFVVRGAPYLHKEYKNFSKRYTSYLKLKKRDINRYYEKVSNYLPIKEISAGELQRGDLLLYPINRTEADVTVIDLSEYSTKSTRLGPVPKDIPLQVPVDDNFLKLIGYWIAEGSSHRAYIRFSLGNHEEEFAAEIVQLIKKVFGLEAKIYRRPNSIKTGLEITACHAKLANILENLCGKGASNKHIPFILQELPVEKQKVLLNAIHKGDGTSFIANHSTKKHKAITTVSLVLAEQLVDIVLRMHLFPTRYVAKTKIDKLGVNHKEAYTVFWSEEAIQRYNAIYFDKDGSEYWLLPITDLKKELYEGPVYNFTVDKDHSYIATNFAVANCGKGGDAYSFLMEYEHMEFPEALRTLAKRAGVTLTAYLDNGTGARKEQIYRLNGLAAEYYHYILTRHEAGKRARAYLDKRGVNPKLIETFQLGFAPARGNGLAGYLIGKKKFQPDDLVEAGLAFRRGRDTVDFFRGRLMFPLFDHRGNLIGFSGRVLTGEQTSKYINTRDTLAYHKSDVVFGLNITKQAVIKAKQVILLEGEFDVMTCFENGISNVVAVKGTALTENQVQLLKRFAPKLTFCFDGDSAGQEAIKRSLPLVEKQGLSATVILIKDGKDPDEALKKNPAGFKKSVKEEIGAYDYLLEALLAKYGSRDAQAKKAVAEEFLPLLATVKNEIIKEHYLRKFAASMDTSYESAGRELQRAVREERTAKVTVTTPKKVRSRGEILEEYVLALLLQNDVMAENVATVGSALEGLLGESQATGKLLKRVLAAGQGGNFESKQFGRTLPKELEDAYNTSLLLPLPEFTTETKRNDEIAKSARQLREYYIREKLAVLAERMKLARTNQEQDALVKMQSEYGRLVALLSQP